MRNATKSLAVSIALLLLSLCAGVLPPALAAGIPEIQHLKFASKTTMGWDSAPTVETYNIYRGDLAALRSSKDYGNCFSPGLTLPQGTDPANPPPGSGYVYLIDAAIGAHEGTLGKDSKGFQRTSLFPCLTLPSPLRTIIDPDVPDFDGVRRGVEAARNPAVANDLTRLAGGGVYLHTGEFFIQATDLEIPGRGLSWRHVRSYRSQINHDGQQGRNWTFNYDRRVVSTMFGIAYLDGTGRQDDYLPTGPLYEPVDPGIYTKIRQNEDGTFTLRERDGTLYHHRPLDGSSTAGSLYKIEDRLGNYLSFLYYPNGLLKCAVDTLGREIDYYWNTQARLDEIVDFAGRYVRFGYDLHGNLTSATSPPVTGTSTGNDFPSGKTTAYTYLVGTGDLYLDHNLLTVTAPGDPVPVIQNTFNTNDEIQTQYYGGSNASGVPAGGLYQYTISKPGTGFREIAVHDRNGILHAFTTDLEGHATREEVHTIGLRPSDPPSFVTTSAYNSAGELTQTTYPLGNQVLFTFDDVNPDRFQRGNLTSVRRVADARGNGFGASLPDIEVEYECEPLYTQQRLITDPLGHESTYTFDYQEGDPILNGVADLAMRWNIDVSGIPLSRGDVNGDGTVDQAKGNPVALAQPTVSLAPGSRQASIEGGSTQSIRTLWRYNDLAQLIVQVDPEYNVTLHSFYPENDPDGDGLPTPAPPDGRTLRADTGGYLASTTLDADPVPYLTPAEVAMRDNHTNPPATEILNEHGYNAVGDLTWFIDGNGVKTVFEINALDQNVAVWRGATSYRSVNVDPDPPTSGVVSQRYYNESDQMIRQSVQDLGDLSGTGGFADTEFVYDILGHQVSMTQEVGNGIYSTTQYRWSPQGERTAVIFPEGNQFTMQLDERGLLYRLVRGDDDYDASNGGPVGSSLQSVNYDANGNPTEFVDGRGTSWTMGYDGDDRRVTAASYPADSFFDVFFNADESIAGTRVRNALATTTYYDSLHLYDELGREKETREAIRNSGGVLLTEDYDHDGYVSVLTEFDRNSRRSRVWTDNRQIQDFDSDGAGRVIHKLDALGNDARLQYDDGNNVVSTTETEVGPAGVETFVTTNAYDRLNRLTSTTDGMGRTKSFMYDSRDNFIKLTDALGNTISYYNNGLNRRTKIVRDLRAGGGAPGPVTDQITYEYRYDLNSRLERAIDPKGYATQSQYDTLDRKVRDVYDDGTTSEYGYDGNDNVVRVVDANGSVITITLDTADRPTQRTVSPAAGVHANTQTFTYDKMNRLIRAVDQNDVGSAERTDVQFTYDSLNRVRTENSRFGTHTTVGLSFTNDGNGNRTSATFPGNTLSYSYDPLNRLIGSSDTLAGFSAQYSYLGPERLAERRHGNGTRKSYLDASGTADIGYDGVKRVKAVRHYDPTNVVLAGFDYTRDPEGNVTSESRTHHLGRGDVWVYDSAYRLVDFKRDVDNPVAEQQVPGSGGLIRHRVQYTLDRVGNWLQRIVDGTTTLGNTPNNLNEYDDPQSGGTRVDDGIPDDVDDNLGTPTPDGTNLAHDKNGDLVKEGTRTYEYDAFHRLVWVKDGGLNVAHYVYDGLNRRIAKWDYTTGDTGRFLYDGEQLIEERDWNETLVNRRFFYGAQGELVAMQQVTGSVLYYLHDDVHGSVVMVTNPAAAVVERVTYDAYGAPEFQDAANNPTGLLKSVVGNPFLYQGQYYDPETRFYEKRGAIFAPRYGRHIQRYLPGQHVGPLGMALNVPMLFPCPVHWLGLNPFWWGKAWFWHPLWWNSGWWAWKPFWWFGGAWGWWWWQPWVWFGATGFGWWVLRPWWFWWHAPFMWWGWQVWWRWPGWWGFWPFWGWFGWMRWLPVWGWLGWQGWWPFWAWWGWRSFWPACGWWGWWGWWPWWSDWWGWHPFWWWGWWTWSPWPWFHFWGWSGLSFWWNWHYWIRWWPWGWWHWLGWLGWWGWYGWNPWWWWGWGSWWFWGWIRGFYWWWGPIGWWPWFCWGWWPWWWWGWWGWLVGWGCWFWRIGWFGFWKWGTWWGWMWNWWTWPWWGWWWPWWGWWF